MVRDLDLNVIDRTHVKNQLGIEWMDFFELMI